MKFPVRVDGKVRVRPGLKGLEKTLTCLRVDYDSNENVEFVDGDFRVVGDSWCDIQALREGDYDAENIHKDVEALQTALDLASGYTAEGMLVIQGANREDIWRLTCNAEGAFIIEKAALVWPDGEPVELTESGAIKTERSDHWGAGWLRSGPFGTQPL